jgi:hypothetical protein
MKAFDQTLYADNDDAKNLIIELLDRNGWSARVNPDPYGIDLLAANGTKNISVEVEVKHRWSGPEFPYSTVQIPARKKKFAELADSQFVVINAERTHCLITSGKAVINSKLLVVPNKYVAEGEQFFSVPLSDFTLVKL